MGRSEAGRSGVWGRGSQRVAIRRDRDGTGTGMGLASLKLTHRGIKRVLLYATVADQHAISDRDED